MNEPHFVLSRKVVKEQVQTLEDLGLHISYSYKTNHEVGDVLQTECDSVHFSIHAKEEIPLIKDKSKITFFVQAENVEELSELINQGITSFVIDNEIDLENLKKALQQTKTSITLSLRMKFSEHRIGTGKYFVYGMHANKVNELITQLKNNPFIKSLGIHIHRKSQNTSEWEITSELQDSLTKETLQVISFVNLGGGLPSVYKSFTVHVLPYIFKKLTHTKEFLDKYNISTIIEPGRFICAPAVTLHTKIIQIQEKNIIINTTIYNCALDTHMTGTKMLINEERSEQESGNYFLIKGNSPTRDDIFRYKVKLKNPLVGDNVTFLNAGAYNYTTDFFGYKKLKTIITE